MTTISKSVWQRHLPVFNGTLNPLLFTSSTPPSSYLSGEAFVLCAPQVLSIDSRRTTGKSKNDFRRLGLCGVLRGRVDGSTRPPLRGPTFVPWRTNTSLPQARQSRDVLRALTDDKVHDHTLSSTPSTRQSYTFSLYVPLRCAQRRHSPYTKAHPLDKRHRDSPRCSPLRSLRSSPPSLPPRRRPRI